MACRLSCLFVAYCSSLITVQIVAGSIAPLGKEALVVGKVANEPDPDSTGSGSVLHRHGRADKFLHEKERSYKFGELKKPLRSFVADTESTNLGLVFDNDDDDESLISTVLSQNGLPIGLLPSCVKSYTLSDDGKFSVSLEETCYVDFDYEVYYSQTITGTLSYGTISDLSGIQAKKAFLWLAVTGIRIDTSSSSYIYFDVGPISKKLSIAQFATIPTCKANAMDFSALV